MENISSKKIPRRDFLKTSGLFLSALALGGCAGTQSPRERSARATSGKPADADSAVPAGADGMPQRTLGQGFAVSALGLGCMGMSHGHGAPRDKKAMRNLIAEAVDNGVNFFDTAEIYGPHTNEELVGEALAPYRDRVFIGSKFGLYYPNGQQLEDARPERIRQALEGSLKRLRTDHIDIYYQHRIDEKVPIEDVAGTMGELVREGKIRHWGMSEPRPETIRRAHKVFPVTAVENQYAMSFRRHEEETFAVLEELGIGLVAYSPLDRGYLGGLMDGNTRFDPATDMRAAFPRMQPEAMAKNRVLIDFLNEIGREKNATCAQIALAWILDRKPWIVPIPETTQRAHLLENLQAVNIRFTPEERSRIDAFLDGFVPAGERYVPGSPAAKSVWNLI